MRTVLLLLCAFALFASGQIPSLLGLYDFDVELGGALTDGHINSTSVFHLYYSVRPPLINFGIVADTRDTSGWASFGFSSNGLMFPGDVAVGIVDATGGHLADFYLSGRLASLNNVFCSNGFGAVCYDPIELAQNGVTCADNLSNRTITRTGTFLILQYSRPIAASDFCDLPFNLTGPNYIIYAIGPAVSTYAWPYNVQYHTVRANFTLNFRTTPPQTTSATTGVLVNTTGTVSVQTVAQTSAVQTSAQTTAVTVPATTSSGTTGVPVGVPPTLVGYSHDVDLSKNLTNGFTTAPYPQYFHLYYTYADPTLSIGIVAYSVDGWVGFGWSPSGIMDTPGMPSDAVLAYVDGLNNLFITDFALLGRNAPGSPTGCAGSTTGICPDISIGKNCQDNVSLKSLKRQGSYIVVEFSRPVVASDVCDVAVLPTGAANQNIIFAVGPTVASQPWPYSVQFHSYHNNGTAVFNWIPNPKNGGAQVVFSIFLVLAGLIVSVLM